MKRYVSLAPVLAATAALVLSMPAFAIGDITCETPDTIFGATVAPGEHGSAGDIQLARVDASASLEVTALGAAADGGDRLFECVMGPLPPLGELSAVGGVAEQAYIEHGLAADTAWAGLSVNVAAPEAGLAVGTDISVLGLDLDAGDGSSEHFLVSVQRVDARTGAELVIRRGIGAGREVARLPLADGTVALAWPGKSAPDAPLVIAVGDRSYSTTVAPGSSARAVRMGYLGLDSARHGGDQIYLVDPTFHTR